MSARYAWPCMLARPLLVPILKKQALNDPFLVISFITELELLSFPEITPNSKETQIIDSPQ
jgi:hypothetical protein